VMENTPLVVGTVLVTLVLVMIGLGGVGAL